MDIHKEYIYGKNEIDVQITDKVKIVVNEVLIINLCQNCSNYIEQSYLNPSINYGVFKKLQQNKCMFDMYTGTVFKCSHYKEKEV